MGLVYVTTATEHPVTIEELKLHSHVDGNDEDQMLETYVGAATQLAQRRLDRQLCTASLKLTLDEFPSATRHNPLAAIRVPRPPLRSVTSIGYIATDGTTATMASTDYVVDTASEPGRIVPVYGQVWPIAQDQINSVIVTYTAGYGAADTVPKNLKTWILSVGAHLFRNREPVSTDDIQNVPYFEPLLMSEDYGRV